MSTPLILVVLGCVIYIFVFSFMSIRRIHVLWASYFDLGIMHQTVYNTYKAIQTFDPTRVLELTDPHESGRQINRIAIHNDVLLAAAAPFYYIYAGPETILVIQTVVLASGALALFFIVREKTKHLSQEKRKLSRIFATLIPFAYLLYYPVQKTNLYEFHAVTLATALILWMYLAYIKKKWVSFIILFISVLLSKEHTGFSLGVFILLEIVWVRAKHIWRSSNKIVSLTDYFLRSRTQIWLIVAVGSFIYVIVSVFVIMPSYRLGSDHFALNYFSKDSTGLFGFVAKHVLQFFSFETARYVFTITSPLLFLPLFSLYVLPAVPDILINALSANPSMRNVYFQYTAVITPWLFLGVVDVLSKLSSHISLMQMRILLFVFAGSILVTSALESPLPYSLKNQNRLWYGQESESRDVLLWQQILRSDDIIVSATGQFAPYLTSRRVYYDFGKNYDKAEYVLIRRSEIEGYWIKGKLEPFYEQLMKDKRYTRIYTNSDIEVYKRTPNVD